MADQKLARISVRRLAQYLLCPRNAELWRTDPLQGIFQTRARMFRTALLTYVREGFEPALMILTDLVQRADTPQKAGIYRRSINALAGFHTYVQENGIAFRPKGARHSAVVERYVVTVDLKLVEDLPGGGQAGWMLFDFAEMGLDDAQVAIVDRVTKWVLAQAGTYKQIVRYIPQTGKFRRSDITPEDTFWDPHVILPLLKQAVHDNATPPKRPGRHCSRCWHLKQGRCDAQIETSVLVESE